MSAYSAALIAIVGVVLGLPSSGFASCHETRVCEHRTLKISCPDSKTIKINRASYGRSEGGHICPHRHIQTTQCNAGTSMDVVKRKCHGKIKCEVEAKNGVFGDPCVGTFKYLQVEYECDVEPMFARVCEQNAMTIGCPSGTAIDIETASYGRSDSDVCPSSHIQTTQCHAVSSEHIVNSKCNGVRQCEIHASNDVFGDPCSGTYKYLEVEYRCREPPIREVTVCEGHSLEMNCPCSTSIKIHSATYGRNKEGQICVHPHILTTNCKAESSTSVVKEKCEGRRECQVMATNGEFGDPCLGTYKYLEVIYECS